MNRPDKLELVITDSVFANAIGYGSNSCCYIATALKEQVVDINPDSVSVGGYTVDFCDKDGENHFYSIVEEIDADFFHDALRNDENPTIVLEALPVEEIEEAAANGGGVTGW